MPTADVILYIQSGSDALHRVISVCHRRGLEILALSYVDQEVRLAIAGDDRQLRQVDRWLVALVSVLEVDCRERGAFRTTMLPH